MSSLVFLFAVAMIAALIIWSILNDKVGTVGETRGLFAMRDDIEPSRAAEELDRPDSSLDRSDFIGRG